jgi:LPS-assembly protein
MKFIKIFLFNFFLFLNSAYAIEQFNFDVTQAEILNDGNIFKGINGGTATSADGLVISADTFEYNKILNILNAYGDVKVEDKENDQIIFTEKMIYLKNEEKIVTKGETKAIIESNYNFLSSDMIFLKKDQKLISKSKSSITDKNFNLYEFDNFEYLINRKLLKANNLKVTTNYTSSNNQKDIFNFENGFFNLDSKDFIAKDTKISVKKNIFDNTDNDPRIEGVSSKRKGNITEINKATFTSCKKDDNCPPWSINADKIIHDNKKKQLIYKDALLKIYDIPVLYFPKFFHPDPTVKRQSGLLQPRLNNSETLGSSFLLPYFHVISDNKDITFKPTIFDSDIYMFQNEYREKRKNSSFIIDVGQTIGYQSSTNNKKKSIGHLFSKLNFDLGFKSFNKSSLDISLEKTTNDTYLKVFESNLIDMDEKVKPASQSQLLSNIIFNLDHKNFNLETGMSSYETLGGLKSDKFQYILPYYNFDMPQFMNNTYGKFNFSSNGSNKLKDTNSLTTSVNNNLNFLTNDFILKSGIVNNIGIYFKNTNKVGKKVSSLKNSPQLDLTNIINFQTRYPLVKIQDEHYNSLIPKLSFRINPTDMKNYNTENRKINTSNIFSINRLGLDDTFEEGKSLTVGLDYRKETLKDINKFFEFKVASVFRDKRREFIPLNSTLGQKSSNLFGSASSSFSELFDIKYNFALDNNLKNFEYNSIGLDLNFEKITSNFEFIEENGKMGDANSLENSTTFNFDESNYLTFKTRRNRKINLTEFYDLVYEYKNDCLTAGIKYKKTYYQDRDYKPKEDLLFTITLFPLTQYEQKIDDNLYN